MLQTYTNIALPCAMRFVRYKNPSQTLHAMRLGRKLVQRRVFSVSHSRRLMQESLCFSESQLEVRDAISKICSKYTDAFWRDCDENASYPHDLHKDLANGGWVGIALPEDLGGAGLGISEATIMLQTIAQSGAGIAGAQCVHANVYATQPVAKFATGKQKQAMLPKLISGEWKACFGVTEPRSGERF